MFMNPSWWVRSYEVASSSKAPFLTPLELSCDSGLTPALNAVELSALSIVLSNIQKQLLAGRRTILLDPVQHRKFVSSTSRSRIFSFERILQILTGLRLLSGNKSEGFDVIPLFDGEAWRRKGYYNGLVIELGLAPLGAELAFGLGEPYSELERLVSKKPRAQRHLGSHGPLGLWQSIWLDLQGLEQILLLRVEKSMQWENRWLRLDGVFGNSIPELFKDLELPKARGKSSQWSAHRIRQRVLERLGRKLMEHGLLSFDLDDEYLALGPDQDDFALVWQAGPEYLNQIDASSYQSKVGVYLRDAIFEQNLPNITRVLLGPIFKAELAEELGKVWRELQGVNGMQDYRGLIHGNLPVMLSCLFFEWVIRQLPGHGFPIPASHADRDYIKLAVTSESQSVSERFEQFCNLVREDDNFLRDLEDVSGLTLVSPKTQSTSEVYRYFAELQSLGQPTIPVVERKTPTVQPPTSKPAEQPVQDSGPARYPSNLKKAATEELARLRKQVPEKYVALKNAYINTLDPEKKKIIVEVMDRLQPKTFDDHLRNSLVKYMVENPESWLPTAANQQP
ncbi:hypothetical protein SAMN06296036_10165 [Pseudobacteriovorax antillogorgiicola]|uniref:Uncharacterized protein n=2 Tax=Pseudobacteriovorax antillogorgiicola TaxID=1513793 RepID=A0A1Y6B2A2_9BACT|nr:hypothetical protein EDD56_101420 [Pseudobacteriovorax antillogorgiicola]SME87902.1 hypothetical protein SAMN06296036_10165 [Pseudobacteriovorax antillogorgiicola]